ncbi:MAG: hypothetical protein ABS95_02665 [Verrucomicrobia bacterium SCN 57-15]|nr:MAG: hypothetical protein ABS95_02665 [Verrucomicrobia bacterium SCN 57-15]
MFALSSLNMKRRAKGVWKRTTAAAALLAWVGALALCSADPWLCQCPSEQGDPHSHATAESHGHEGRGDRTPTDVPHEKGFCASLKSTVLTSVHSLVQKPNVVPVWILSSPFLCPNPSTESAECLSVRQAKRVIWVFTPEVCLGPGFRSLAPPLPS